MREREELDNTMACQCSVYKPWEKNIRIANISKSTEITSVISLSVLTSYIKNISLSTIFATTVLFPWTKHGYDSHGMFIPGFSS